MPVPMIAPTPSSVSCTGPSDRCRDFFSAVARMASSGFMRAEHAVTPRNKRIRPDANGKRSLGKGYRKSLPRLCVLLVAALEGAACPRPFSSTPRLAAPTPPPAPMKRLTVPAIQRRKTGGVTAEPLVMLTAYTARQAQLLDPHCDPAAGRRFSGSGDLWLAFHLGRHARHDDRAWRGGGARQLPLGGRRRYAVRFLRGEPAGRIRFGQPDHGRNRPQQRSSWKAARRWPRRSRSCPSAAFR